MPMLRVTTVHNGLPGSPYLTTFHFRNDGGEVNQDIISAVDQFWESCNTSIANGNSAVTQGLVLQVNEVNGDLIGEFSGAPATALGTDSASDTWTAKQGILKLRTVEFNDGSRIQGRIFIPGVTTDSGIQVPDSAYKADVEGAAALLQTGSATLGLPWCIWRRPRLAQPDGTPARAGTFGDVTQGIVSDQWGVLRSRRT